MYAHAAFVPLIDSLFPVKQVEIDGTRSFFQPKPLPQVNLRRNGEHMLTMEEAHDRLSLLVLLELPCTILIADPYQVIRQRAIKSINYRCGESLSIHGQDFKLNISGPNFHSIRLVNHRHEEDGNTTLDIHDSKGMLCASIQPIPEGTGAAVWRDVMENPSLSLS